MNQLVSTLFLFGLFILINSGCVGTLVQTQLQPDALPGPELRKSGGELVVGWKPDPSLSRIYTSTGIFLESTSTHIMMLSRSTREAGVIYTDLPQHRGQHKYTEIPIESVQFVDLIMPSLAGKKLMIMILCGDALTFSMAQSNASKDRPFQITYGEEPNGLAAAAAPFLAGVTIGWLAGSAYTYGARQYQYKIVDRVVQASRKIAQSREQQKSNKTPSSSPPPY